MTGINFNMVFACENLLFFYTEYLLGTLLTLTKEFQDKNLIWFKPSFDSTNKNIFSKMLYTNLFLRM